MRSLGWPSGNKIFLSRGCLFTNILVLDLNLNYILECKKKKRCVKHYLGPFLNWLYCCSSVLGFGRNMAVPISTLTFLLGINKVYLWKEGKASSPAQPSRGRVQANQTILPGSVFPGFPPCSFWVSYVVAPRLLFKMVLSKSDLSILCCDITRVELWLWL